MTAGDPRSDAVLVRGVGKIYSADGLKTEALADIDLAVGQGRFATLFGPSGCGKSTLLRIMAGLEEQTSGSVSLFGLTPRQATQKKNISWVPQSPALLPWLSVRNNLLISRMINRKADRLPNADRSPQDVQAVLAEVGLADFADARPGQLSGGMRQRAALARGFVLGAPLLLMDEPFSALDELTRNQLCWHLLNVWEHHRKTVIFVTHSAFEAVLLSDVVIVMTPRPGRVRAIIEINLPRPRSWETTETPEFGEIIKRVKLELRSALQDVE